MRPQLKNWHKHLKKVIPSINKIKSPISILSLALIIYTFILAYLAYTQEVWVDEAYSLHTTSKDLPYAFSQSINFEAQAPLYFLILKIWRYIDNSVVFARLLSVLFTIIALFLIKKISVRYIPGLPPAFLIFFIGLNPFTIWCAHIIRVYSLVLLLSIIILHLFHKIYITGNTKSKLRVLYASIAIISVFTHYFLGFLLAANGFVLLASKKFYQIKAYLVDMIIPFLLIIVYYYTIIINQYTDHAIHIITKGDIGNVVKFFAMKIETLLIHYYIFDLTSLERNMIRFFIFISLITLAIFYRNTKRPNVIKNNFAFPILVFTLLLFFLVQYNSGGSLLSTWHLSALFIPLMIVVAFTINSIYKPGTVKYIFLILMIYYIGLDIYDTLTNRDAEYKQPAEFISKQEKNDQPILLYRGELSLPFSYNYKGINKIYPLPGTINFNRPYNDTCWVINSKQEFAHVISKFHSKSKQYWAIMDGTSVLLGLNYNYNQLDSLIRDNFITRVDTTFKKLRVRLIEAK